jgi:ABC-type multidrug transport system fused ATPase/permease subunit
MVSEIYITNIIKIIFTIIGGHLAITKILPLIKDFLDDFLNDKATKALISLLTVAIIVIVANLIIGFTTEIGNNYLNYINLIKPLLDVITNLFNYLQYVVAIALIAYAIKNFKK